MDHFRVGFEIDHVQLAASSGTNHGQVGSMYRASDPERVQPDFSSMRRPDGAQNTTLVPPPFINAGRIRTARTSCPASPTIKNVTVPSHRVGRVRAAAAGKTMNKQRRRRRSNLGRGRAPGAWIRTR